MIQLIQLEVEVDRNISHLWRDWQVEDGRAVLALFVAAAEGGDGHRGGHVHLAVRQHQLLRVLLHAPVLVLVILEPGGHL